MRIEQPETATGVPPEMTLAQWFSPAFPIGAFAYSHGLEWAIEAGYVHDARSLTCWVTDVLEHGSGRNDALFMAAAYRARDAAALLRVDAHCRAFAASAERLKETDLQGAAFCDITSAVWDIEVSSLTYPVAAGRAAHLCALPLPLCTRFYLQSFLTSLVTVGLRLIPLGQTRGHAIIRDLTSLCAKIAEQALHGTLEDVSSTAFVSDIAAMNHETQYARVFRT